jgi:hypothetical protein
MKWSGEGGKPHEGSGNGVHRQDKIFGKEFFVYDKQIAVFFELDMVSFRIYTRVAEI